MENWDGRERREYNTCPQHVLVEERQKTTVEKMEKIHEDIKSLKLTIETYFIEAAKGRILCERRFTSLETKAGLIAIPVSFIVSGVVSWFMYKLLGK